MREIIKTRTIEEVVGYEAIDGTQFDTREECEKYEKITARAVIVERFKKLVVNYIEEATITDCGNGFVGAGCGEDWYFALVKINNETDLDTLRMYKELTYPASAQKIDDSLIGKEVIVTIGERRYDRGYCDEFMFDSCWIWGTIEDQIKLYTENLMQLKDKPFDWDD